MASVREAVKVIADLTGETEAHCNGIARALLDDGQITQSVGRRVHHVTAEDVARLLVGIYVAPTRGTAARFTRSYFDLRAAGRRDGERFGDDIATLLRLIAEGQPIPKGPPFVRIITSWLEGRLEWPATAEAQPTMPYVEPGEDPALWRSDRPMKSVVIPSIAWGRIALATLTRVSEDKSQ